MANASAGGIEIDALALGKHLDVGILGQVLLGPVLDVVVQRAHNLSVIVHFVGTQAHEFRRHRPRVVVRHAMSRLDRHIVSGKHLLSQREPDGVLLNNLFRQVLAAG